MRRVGDRGIAERRRGMASLRFSIVAMLLLALEGLSYREIAKTQEVAIGTVMSRIGRARETLKTIMGELPAHRSGTDQ